MNKREFLKTSFFVTAGVAVGAPAMAGKLSRSTAEAAGFEQIPLPYAFNALEPYIDAATMEIHYTRHAAAYMNNFLKAVKDNGLDGYSMEDIMASVSKYPAAVRNNGGGHFNHNLFWLGMAPATGQMPGLKTSGLLNDSFGSFDAFREKFNASAMSVFGSGWAWLLENDGKLSIITTPNQDNPLMDVVPQKGRILLNLDVWEHAYYLKYQNLRAKYTEAYWNVVNWSEVEKRLG